MGKDTYRNFDGIWTNIATENPSWFWWQ